MNALVEPSDTPLQRGIAALRSALGEDACVAFLCPIKTRADEAAAFNFPLPVDYTGQERKLRIGFPYNFPRGLLTLHVEPSPWLVWPHATEQGLCLHGFKERPVMGSPELVVKDSLSRLAQIVAMSRMGSSKAERDGEFQNEITSYWSRQHGQSSQNLILLDRPNCGSGLFAISDPRQRVPSGQETLWLATDLSLLKNHYRRVVGRTARMRAPETPAFYVKLQSYPDIHIPGPKQLLPWLMPHLSRDDAQQLITWFSKRSSLASRWIAMELPGNANAPVYCLNVRSPGIQSDRGARYGLRTARRQPAVQANDVPTVLCSATLEILDRTSILSRDLSGATKNLENSRVVCIGVGSLGGAVALQLARSGVGHLTLIDPDVLVSPNLGRHVLGADDLGRGKATALREKIRRDLPTTEVVAHVAFAEVVMHKEPEVFESADLVVITTADWPSEVATWRAKSNGTSWRLLQAWSEPHTQVGHALLAPIGAFDGRYLFSENGDFRHKFTEWPSGGIIALPACGQSFVPGGSMGMMNIAVMVSQTALSALTRTVQEATWVSSICTPGEVEGLGGKYHGPEIPEGARQIMLEREWPEDKDQMHE